MLPTLLRKGFLSEHPNELPVQVVYNKIKSLKNSGEKIFLLKSETGSGKSTVLPPYLGDLGYNVMSVQPNIVTCDTIFKDITTRYKKYVPGYNIGYQAGDTHIMNSDERGIYIMTTGTFTKTILMNPESETLLKKFDVVIIDEAHDMDLFGVNMHFYIKQFVGKYKSKYDCPVFVITSATFNEKIFADYYGSKHFMAIAGVNHKIEDIFLEYDTKDIYAEILRIIREILKAPKGDILVFLSTMKEINEMFIMLQKQIKNPIELIPFTKATSEENQKFVMKKSNRTRVILSTNITEKGITIPGLKYVIDSMYQKPRDYLPDYDILLNFKKPISQYSSHQRRGRVGRESTGFYYPLISQESYKLLPLENYNTTYTSDITLSVFELISQSSFDILIGRVKLIYEPNISSIWRAVEKLFILGLIGTDMKITPMGQLFQKFQYVNAEQFRVIMAAYVHEVHVLDVITMAAAMAQENFDYTAKSQFFFESQCTYIPMIEELYNIEKSKNNLLEIIKIREYIMTSLYDNNFNCCKFAERSFETRDDDYISRLKKCLYEGLKYHLAVWNGEFYQTRFGFAVNYFEGNYVNSFVYGNIEITGSDKKKRIVGYSVLDNHVNYTLDF